MADVFKPMYIGILVILTFFLIDSVITHNGRLRLIRALGSVSEGGRDFVMAKALNGAVDKFNGELPRKLGDGLVMDFVESSGTEFIINHTLTDIDSNYFYLDSIQKNLRDNITGEACAARELEFFFEGGVTVTFLFYGNDSKELYRLSIDKPVCDNLGKSIKKQPA